MTDIAELFSRDPNLCSKQDIAAIVNEFRAKQSLFKQGVAMAGSTKAKPKKEPATKLDLSDLGL